MNDRYLCQWLAILCSSAAIGALLAWVHIPAALLLGPMLAGNSITAAGGTARVPNAAFLVAQGMAMQTTRLLALITVAPALVGYIAAPPRSRYP